MSADPKVLERIGKLLRLAAPVSGTSEAERASAALEAARLIHEHGIAIQGSKKDSGGRISHGAWVKTQALDRCSCSRCHNIICPGDIVWLRIIEHRKEFRHNAGPCSVT